MIKVRRRVDFLKEYLRTTGAAGYLLAISGGQDSALAGKLGQLAVEEVRAEGSLGCRNAKGARYSSTLVRPTVSG